MPLAEQLQAAQRQFDLRARAKAVVEDDRRHLGVQFRGYCARHGIPNFIFFPDDLWLRIWGAR